MLELIDIAGTGLIVAALYIALGMYVRRRWPAWATRLGRRRVGLFLLLILAVAAVKVTEDALTGDSRPIDEAILWFVRRHVPGSLGGFFEAVTFTASARILFPLTAGAAVTLLWVKRRSEALILAASVIGAATIVYVVKTAAGRGRPALWEAEWYWGSSFPSGHTLVATAFATAAALCVSRIAPTSYKFVLPVAILWALVVGLSRMVLGVHWPTDVLAAWCIGALLPLAAGVALGLGVDGAARAA